MAVAAVVLRAHLDSLPVAMAIQTHRRYQVEGWGWLMLPARITDRLCRLDQEMDMRPTVGCHRLECRDRVRSSNSQVEGMDKDSSSSSSSSNNISKVRDMVRRHSREGMVHRRSMASSTSNQVSTGSRPCKPATLADKYPP